MPVLRSPGEQRGPAASGGTAGPFLERVVPFAFTAADRTAGYDDLRAFRDHMEALYGPGDDFAWLAEGPGVNYHDMARTVARELGDELDGVDLVVTVSASPDCRHESLPACVLAGLIPGNPLVMGVGDQGVAGPFTALRIAFDLLATGTRRRALVLLTEQSTVPPGGSGPRPRHDVAVALLLGTRAGMPLSRPTIEVTDLADGPGERVEVTPVRVPPAVDPALRGLLPGDGTDLVWGEAGHTCTGVWLALTRFLATEGATADSVLVVDRDPVLPYLCTVRIGLPARPPVSHPTAVIPALRPPRRERQLIG